MGVDGADNSAMSSNWDHNKNWRKLRDKQAKVKRGEAKWTPTYSHDAGKGSRERESSVPKAIYDLNWDLAFGNITKEEHEIKVKEFYENMGDID